MLKDDPLMNVLYIDLSRKRFRIEKREDLFEKYIGGTGVATQLLLENCPPGIDPYSPDNPIIFAVGPLTGLFPLASKSIAMFKSPLTGNLGESHAGGRSAIAIRMAGYGAIVIKGANEKPGYLSIHENQVIFRDATTLWGMRSGFTAARVIRENEPAAGLRTIMRIGKAGENLVSYACVTTETYRHFGRLGLGAVFGSKKLKALVVSGKHSVPVTDMRQYRATYDAIFQAAAKSPVMKKYHDLGTAENTLPLSAAGGLPTRNLQSGSFEGAENISGETLAEEHLGRRLACSNCPVGCIHIAALREPYEDEAYYYKTSMVSYDYELIFALGSMLGIDRVDGMLKLIDRIEAFGLDAMSSGVILAWATEAQEKGLINEQMTDGIHFTWGDYASYMDAVKKIVEQPNEFYRNVALGVDHASSVYGGSDYAMAFGKNEMAGYHTGPGAHLGLLIGTRHSHLDNAGYSVDQKVLAKKRLSPEELIDNLTTEERWRQILSSLAVCFFARGIYDRPLVLNSLKSAGFDWTEEDLRQAEETIYRNKYAFKLREGFSVDKLRLPQRIFQTPTPVGELNEGFMRQALTYFKQFISANVKGNGR